MFKPISLNVGLKIDPDIPFIKYIPPRGVAEFKFIGGDPRQNSSISGKSILAVVSTCIIKESTYVHP